MKRYKDTDYYITEDGQIFRKWKDGFKKRKSTINKDGYYQISLKRKTFLTHRLIAETYILNPNNLPIVEHKDDNKSVSYTHLTLPTKRIV